MKIILSTLLFISTSIFLMQDSMAQVCCTCSHTKCCKPRPHNPLWGTRCKSADESGPYILCGSTGPSSCEGTGNFCSLSACSTTTPNYACGSGRYMDMTSAACTTCPAGNKCDGSAKTPCSTRTYQPNPGQSSCTPCPAGFSVNSTRTECGLSEKRPDAAGAASAAQKAAQVMGRDSKPKN